MTTADFTAGFSAPGVADAYDDVLVPRLFAPCAVVLLARLGLTPGETLLDVACGTGIVARLAASVLGPAGRVLGRDLNQPMLERGRTHRLPPDSAPVELGVAPAAALDLPDGSVDAVTCQHGLQFFPDPVAALAEAHRVVRPGGRIALVHYITAKPVEGMRFIKAFGLSTGFDMPMRAVTIYERDQAGLALA